MSKIKRYFEDRIEALAKETGYAYDFLADRWAEEQIDGEADFDYFVGVTLERDW